MTKGNRGNKILGISRDSKEGVPHFRDKIECVMAEYGYSLIDEFLEHKGAVTVKIYGGTHNQFLVYKTATRGDENSLLGWNEDSGPNEKYDAFVSLKGVPLNVAEELAKSFVKFDEPKKKSETPGENYTGEIPDILPINKARNESRRDFRRRLNEFLVHNGFENVESEASDDGDFLYKIYEGKNGELVDATFAGDNIADTYGFDYETQEMFLPYAEDFSNSLVDAALIFEGLAPEIKDRLYSELEQKFKI